MSRKDRLSSAIDTLAGKLENGHLLAASDSAEFLTAAASEIDRLTRELAEAKARAGSAAASLPDGCIAVNREKLERIADAIFSKRHNAQENGDAYDVGYFGKMLEDLEAMLSARPEFPSKEPSDVE